MVLKAFCGQNNCISRTIYCSFKNSMGFAFKLLSFFSPPFIPSLHQGQNTLLPVLQAESLKLGNCALTTENRGETLKLLLLPRSQLTVKGCSRAVGRDGSEPSGPLCLADLFTTGHNWKRRMSDNARGPIPEMEEDSHHELQNTSRLLEVNNVYRHLTFTLPDQPPFLFTWENRT